MKWTTALFIGAILGFALPMALGGQHGAWMESFARWGTIHPLEGSPALIFSVPIFLLFAIALRFFFNWHRN
jgi:hypothetical protein